MNWPNLASQAFLSGYHDKSDGNPQFTRIKPAPGTFRYVDYLDGWNACTAEERAAERLTARLAARRASVTAMKTPVGYTNRHLSNGTVIHTLLLPDYLQLDFADEGLLQDYMLQHNLEITTFHKPL